MEVAGGPNLSKLPNGWKWMSPGLPVCGRAPFLSLISSTWDSIWNLSRVLRSAGVLLEFLWFQTNPAPVIVEFKSLWCLTCETSSSFLAIFLLWEDEALWFYWELCLVARLCELFYARCISCRLRLTMLSICWDIICSSRCFIRGLTPLPEKTRSWLMSRRDLPW